MRIDGEKVPHLSVKATFGKVIAGFEYNLEQKGSGGGRLSSRAMRPLDFSVPVILKRPSNKSWEEVMQEVTDVLFKDQEAHIDLIEDSGRYVYGYITALDLGDEQDTVSEADMQVVSEYGYFFGKQRQIDITADTDIYNIGGQISTPWEVHATISERTDKFELWFGDSYIRLNFSFIPGDKLVVKYERREVTLNGRDIRHSVSVKSHFEKLPKGMALVRAEQECIVYYNELYY